MTAMPVRVGMRRVGDIHLMVDDRGPEDRPAIVIAVGFGEQLGSAEFPDEFADALCARDWRVVRFDHRDVGLSSGFDDQPVDHVDVRSRVRAGHAVDVPYTLVDMADDVAGIIRSLGGNGRVRLVGVSMGGVIARWTAVRYPDLVDSLVLVMTPFDVRPPEGMPAPDPAVKEKMVAKAVRRDRAEAIEAAVEAWRSYAGPGFPFDEGWTRRRVTFAHDRSYRPEALARQLAAMAASAPIAPHHGSITAPTLIVLGDADPLVPAAHGTALAAAIPRARLEVIRGMGHELPPAAWPQLLDAVAGSDSQDPLTDDDSEAVVASAVRPHAAALAPVVRRRRRRADALASLAAEIQRWVPDAAADAHGRGYSWSQIARHIGVDQATARRRFAGHVRTWTPMTDPD